MLELIITAGREGADLGAQRAAQACGVATGGAPAKGDASLAWAEANVRDSDGTLLFGTNATPLALLVFTVCAAHRRSYYFIPTKGTQSIRPSAAVYWIRSQNIKVLNVAGPGESEAPGIGVRVEAFLVRVFTMIALTHNAGELKCRTTDHLDSEVN